MKPKSPLLKCAFALALSACTEPGQPSDQAMSQWTVEGTPTLILGGDVDSAGPLYRVTGVVRLKSGYLVVNAGAQELRNYSADGRLLKTIGREGAGPGEFRTPRFIGYLAADSVAIADGSNRRISVICEGSTVCAEWTVPAAGSAFAMVGDTILFKRIAPDLQVDRVVNEQVWLTASRRASQQIDTLFGFEGIPRYTQQLPGAMMSMPVPFTHLSSVVMVDGQIIVSDGQRARLSVYGLRGDLQDSLVVPVVPRPLTDAEIRSAIEERVAATPAERRAVTRSFYEAMPKPANRSPIRQLLVDRADLTWIELDADDPREHNWIVMDSGGAVKATVTTPSGFEVMEIGIDYLLGVWSDALDVEFVHEYRLTRN